MYKADVSVAEFKAHCTQLIDQVSKKKTPLIITKRGKPTARLMPIDEEMLPLFGCMKGSVQMKGDIISPINEPWDADA